MLDDITGISPILLHLAFSSMAKAMHAEMREEATDRNDLYGICMPDFTAAGWRGTCSGRNQIRGDFIATLTYLTAFFLMKFSDDSSIHS
jgi:hypothetical protein